MAKDDWNELDIEQGDFLYQVDQELFLVLMDEREDSYLFSVHGWRDIDKGRAHEYVKGEPGKLHDQEMFEEVVREKGDDDVAEKYAELKELFERFADDFDTGPGERFAMEDKPE
jgi:negative regulator of genetic competence, sporulation and motility